ncbi:MAG: ATP-dependent helicase [Thermoanaerobaculia bacterium]
MIVSKQSAVFTLSSQQLAVVASRAQHLQVIACAGSGKTESISRRIAALLAEGSPPESIVAFTFTERAATELKERVAKRTAEALGANYLDRLGPLFVGTIHSYCFRLLQVHVPRYGNFDVLDEHRHAGILSREARRLGLDKLGRRGHWQPVRDFLLTVDVIANELIAPEALADTPLGDCYTAYRAMLDRYHFLSFGQIIALAVEALGDPQILARVRQPLRHLVVDEYQDINPAQEELIRRLAQPPIALSVVGDDDQSIYQWRGADVRNILQFAQRYPDAVTLPLETNRRSRPYIIEAANRFSEGIVPRLSKTMHADRAAGEAEIVAWRAQTPETEAEDIAATIERLHARGFAYRDIAVLFRSVRTSAPPLLDALNRHGIPFSAAGRTGLFLQPEVDLFGRIHAWLADGSWRQDRWEELDPVTLDPLVRDLSSLFPQRQPADIERYLEHWKRERLRGSRPVSLVGDFYRLLRFVGAQTIDPDTPTGAARLGAYARFSRVLADFEHVTRRGRFVQEGGERVFRGGRDRGKPYYQALLNYLVFYARDQYEDFPGEPTVDLNAVDVLTVHQAKGLEWPIVFLPALVAGRFPSRRAGQAQDWLLPETVFPPATRARYEGGDAEERRLFYVAITRARDTLFLSCFARKTNRFRPSPYLLEVAGANLPTAVGTVLPVPIPVSPKEPLPLSVGFWEVARYDECGYRYRLGSVYGFEQELAVELGYGKAIHHVLRLLAEGARTAGRLPKPAEVEALLAAELYLPFANQATVERMHASARRLVDRYLAAYSDDLERVWDTERPFELYLPNGRLAGRADVILDREGGTPGSLAIVDYKTATDDARMDLFELQLAVYTAAGRGEKLDVRAAYLHELSAGDRKAVDVTEARTIVAVERVGELVGRIRSGEWTPRPEAPKCRRCDFRQLCSHCNWDETWMW